MRCAHLSQYLSLGPTSYCSCLGRRGGYPRQSIALCGFCHDLYHKGEITREAIRYWKGILVALNHAFNHETIDDLLFLHKIHDSSLLQVSGDGVLRFSRLIAAGLATFSVVVIDLTTHRDVWLDFERPQISDYVIETYQRRYRVCLTEKGLMLVDAWLKGDRAAVEDALAQAT